MKYIFAAAQGKAMTYGKNAAHIGYELDTQGRLVQKGIPENTRGGLMVLTLSKGNLRSPQDSAEEILLEMAERNYSGIIADTECGYDKSAEQLLRRLEKADTALYVEKAYAKSVNTAMVMISSAVRSGSFDAMLSEAIMEYGARAVLQLERLCQSCPLPCRDGLGKKLTLRERAALQRETGSQGFFSPKLITNYFTYYDRDKKAHFVLYDTSSSVKRKLELAAQRGINIAVAVPEEFEDILNEIW